MSIIYSLITRPSPPPSNTPTSTSTPSPPTTLTNLCSYDTALGNYPSICQQLLKRIPISQNKIYKYDNEYNFYILKDQVLLYVCMVGVGVRVRLGFGFLEEVRDRFRGRYTLEEIMSARDYDMSAGFSETFKSLMSSYNSNSSQSPKDTLHKQLSTLLPIMSQNIQKVLQNEQKVTLLVKKAEKVHGIADEIKKNANLMKKGRNFWAVLAVVVVVAAVVVVGLVVFL